MTQFRMGVPHFHADRDARGRSEDEEQNAGVPCGRDCTGPVLSLRVHDPSEPQVRGEKPTRAAVEFNLTASVLVTYRRHDSSTLPVTPLTTDYGQIGSDSRLVLSGRVTH